MSNSLRVTNNYVRAVFTFYIDLCPNNFNFNFKLLTQNGVLGKFLMELRSRHWSQLPALGVGVGVKLRKMDESYIPTPRHLKKQGSTVLPFLHN